MLFAGLGWSVLGKGVSSALGLDLGDSFYGYQYGSPIRISRQTTYIYC